MSSEFYHLHVHTEYSLLDGAIRLDALFDRCRHFGMDSVAITDHGTMFGVAEFYKKAKAASIKPVIGCEVYVAPRTVDKKTPEDHKGLRHLVLLAKDREGYANLCRLATIAQLEGFYYKPRVDKRLLQEYSSGLIALSACLKGEIPWLIARDRKEEAVEAGRFFVSTFGGDNFFLEVQQNGMDLQTKVNQGLFELSRELSIPLVASNDCHYLKREDKRAHEILLCVQTGDVLNNQDRFKFDSDELYFKSPAEMTEAFDSFPGAIENTAEIVSRCNVEFDERRYHFPNFDATAGETENEMFEKAAREGFEEKLALAGSINPDIDEKLYRDRIDYEIKTIIDMGFPGYFLIVADFIRYAKDKGIPVGPGRGSAAGSMVAYAMGITALDPIEHGLLFERFLNPDRISMPDIDVDFCIEGRDEVYKYVVDRYGGGENVCQIITFGKMKSKAVIRDVGRVLNVSLPEVDEIAKLVPDNSKNLEQAINNVPQIMEKASETAEKKEMIDVSMLLEGLPRHASTHAAGVVIGDRPLVEYLPLYKGKEGEVLTQFDMKYVEELGLVKFDFLGLRNLTVIKNTLKLLRKGNKAVPDMDNIPLDDEKTYDLLSKADTTGVFQLESSGMKDLIKRLHPTGFNDIVALLALYRPGPLESGMTDHYVERKHGREKIEYLFDALEDVLKETYGVIVYQEQVMKIAGVLADYSMADADGLRKAMGKKKAAMMAEHRALFLKGAGKKGHDPARAQELFNLMEKFGGYGFNKSHSAAYAMISYQTAFLKAHYPVEFIAALMTSEMNNTDNVIKYMEECRSHGIEVLGPDINESDAIFTVVGNAIRYGLAAVKNVGEAAIEEIVRERDSDGKFSSVYDLCERVSLSRVNKKVIEFLIKCGAFDSTGYKRSQMMAVLGDAVDHGTVVQRGKNDSQLDLFADTGIGVEVTAGHPELPDIEEWDENDLLFFEKESLGFYFSGNPLGRYEDILQKYCNVTTVSVQELSDGRTVRIGGIIKLVKAHKTKKGDMMAFTQLEDTSGNIEVVVFPDVYVRAHDLITDEKPVVIEGKTQKRENGVKLIAGKIVPIEAAEEEWAASVIVNVNGDAEKGDTVERLKTVLGKYPGSCPFYLCVRLAGRENIIIRASEENSVSCDPALFREVTNLLGPGAIETRCAPVKQQNNNKRRFNKGQTNGYANSGDP